MTAGLSLPPGFEDLQQFVEQWAAPKTRDRMERRMAADGDQRSAFYMAATPRLADALSHLDGKRLDALDERDVRLFELMMALGHVSLAIEVQGSEEDAHAASRKRMVLRRSPSDQARLVTGKAPPTS